MPPETKARGDLFEIVARLYILTHFNRYESKHPRLLFDEGEHPMNCPVCNTSVSPYDQTCPQCQAAVGSTALVRQAAPLAARAAEPVRALTPGESVAAVIGILLMIYTLVKVLA